MNLTRARCVIGITGLMLTTLPLHANVLLPGDSGAPDAFPNPGMVSLPNHIHGTFSFGGGALAGSYDDYVLVDPLGIGCPGCLDFALVLTVTTGNISTFGLSSFAGFTTDVGYVIGSAGGFDPTDVARFPASGADVGFGFTSDLVGGQTTDALIIVTNATSFDTNGFAATNLSATGGVTPGYFGGVISGPFFEPVPEPSTASLLSLALMGIGIAVFRKTTS
jgi:hypothetical protein